MSAPSPTWCLRRSPAGHWYRIPFIYEWDWEAWCKDVRFAADIDDGVPCAAAAGVRAMPTYAVPVHLEKLAFENPQEIP